MNYQKLDAGLIVALKESPEKSLTIFIHTNADLDSAAVALLANLGVNGINNQPEILTAKLSPEQISHLSAQPWVKFLRRSPTSNVKIIKHTQNNL